MKSLTKNQIILLHEKLIERTGGLTGVRDENLLEAAIAAPYQTFGGRDLFPSVIEKAARLGFGLASNHAMIDGNKRIGALAMLTVLRINGYELSFTQNELETIFLQIASSEKSYEDLLHWIKTHETF